MSEDIQERVCNIVAEQLNVPKEQLTAETAFQTDLQADSLDVVELVMEIEDEFGVSIPDEDATKIKTVGDAVRYINEHNA